MDALFMHPTHITVWRQLRGKPIIAGDVRSAAGSAGEKKQDVVHVV